jgi:hypothetical protein
MRAGIFLPDRVARRPDGHMAEYGKGRPRRGPGIRRRARFSAADIAAALIPCRDRLVDQVPLELACARGLTRDQWEIAVDEAIDYLVTEYDVPIFSAAEAQRAFWRSTGYRIKRLAAGRGATVRGSWKRVRLNADEVAGPDSEPEAVAIHQSELAPYASSRRRSPNASS